MQVVDVRSDDLGEASGDPGDAKLATLADKKEAPIVEIDISVIPIARSGRECRRDRTIL